MQHNMQRFSLWLLILTLLLNVLPSAAAADEAEPVFSLNVTTKKSYYGYQSYTTYEVDGVGLKFLTRSNENDSTNGYGSLYIYSPSGSEPVGLNVSVYLKGHAEETRQILPTLYTVPGQYAVVELLVDMSLLAETYGYGEDLYSHGTGFHDFYYDVTDTAGNRIGYNEHTGHSDFDNSFSFPDAYKVDPPDPTENPREFSFTSGWGRLAGGWQYVGGAMVAYRCYFTLVTGPNGGNYTMSFPLSQTEANTVTFLAQANSVYKLTYVYPLSSSASYSYSGSIPWTGPNGLSGAFSLSFSGGKVSAGSLTVELISSAPTLPGDLNGDGDVNARDIALLQRYVAGWDVAIDETAADVNDDGVINARDIALLQRAVAGWDITLY